MIKRKYFLPVLFALIAFLAYDCTKQAEAPASPFGDRPTEEELSANHIKWDVISKKISEDEYEVQVHAWLQKKWHLYSQRLSWKWYHERSWGGQRI